MTVSAPEHRVGGAVRHFVGKVFLEGQVIGRPMPSSYRERNGKMSRVIVVNSISLDGVMQSPGAPDEDQRAGFERGGWAEPYSDEVIGRKMGQAMTGQGSSSLGDRNPSGRWHNPKDCQANGRGRSVPA